MKVTTIKNPSKELFTKIIPNDNKKLSAMAIILCNKLEYELHKDNDHPILLSTHWFENITQRKRHQNARLRNQINHIFSFKFHSKIVHKDVFYSNVYEVSFCTGGRP